jgi:alkylation response protein AidB-like acyl-CoA dehydrogenase
MDPLLRDQFARTLDALPAAEPWPMLSKSGFLDLLRREDAGGFGLALEALFAVAVETGRRHAPPPIVETILARLTDPNALAVGDAEASLLTGGMTPGLARALAAAGAAAQMAGTMEAMIELTIDYARTRHQFGRPIGAFQAVQQQIAQAVEELHAARIAAEAALTGMAERIDIERAAVAKIRAGVAAQIVAAVAHAVHGAIGVSGEYPLHHLSRRLHRWRLAHGGEAWWAVQLGSRLISAGGEFHAAARRLSGCPGD